MKINKNIIKELTEYLNEFNLTEIEYTEKDIKVKVSKLTGANIATVKEIKSEIKSKNIKNEDISGNKSKSGFNLPNPEEMQEHISQLLNGKIGQLASEIAEETSKEFDDVCKKTKKKQIMIMKSE